jgi:outer membrane protein assembly factor BamB
VERATGKLRWQKSFPVPFETAAGGEYHGNGPKSSPVSADGRLFVMSLNGTLPFPQVGGDQNMPTPAIHNGRVLLGGENRGILSLRPERKDGKWSVTDEWHQKKVALDMSSAVINGDYLYDFSHYDSGRLYCLDLKTGDVVWTGPPRTGGNVMFLSLPGHIAALIDNGELRILIATPIPALAAALLLSFAQSDFMCSRRARRPLISL